ncbi:hypothetical protein [Hymenobacter negativus]|uniref:Lipoprotein n=1 Tax=Hymenobacter negativus TaxID=2795026 RepID=A0ABS3QI77_9BACT|nr:hypothetical protein [Hymenobacter negativus]MBO2010937.1 hypothetical protein [Hymenobacter negativus]
MNYLPKGWACILLVTLLSSCTEPAPSGRKPNTSSQKDTGRPNTEAVRYQVLDADCGLFPSTAHIPTDDQGNDLPHRGRFTPTKPQVAHLEQALRTLPLARVSVRTGYRIRPSYLVLIQQNLPRYKRQYFGFYNQQGQPCLYINFFPEHFVKEYPGYTPRWLLEPISVDDGGAGFWSIQYNWTTHQFYDLAHNADG